MTNVVKTEPKKQDLSLNGYLAGLFHEMANAAAREIPKKDSPK